MNILFICNQNKHRSKTAEILFSQKVHSRSAGLYNESPVTEEQMIWADIVVVMEDGQRKEIANRFPAAYLKKRIVSLDIPDMYQFNDQQLVSLLSSRMEQLSELEPLISPVQRETSWRQTVKSCGFALSTTP